MTPEGEDPRNPKTYAYTLKSKSDKQFEKMIDAIVTLAYETVQGLDEAIDRTKGQLETEEKQRLAKDFDTTKLKLIELFKGLNDFMNASEKGLKISHTQLHKFEEAIKEFEHARFAIKFNLPFQASEIDEAKSEEIQSALKELGKIEENVTIHDLKRV